MQKKRKSYRSVSEIDPSPPGPPPPPPLKVDADAAADDGRVGIWKAPLPGGTAELKNKDTNVWRVTIIIQLSMIYKKKT